MRLTTRTNLAMRALMFCAVNDGRLVRKVDIARAANASENHLALVIHMLSQAGFLDTVRGRRGGMRLNRPASEISVGQVFRSFEADVPFTECFDEGGNSCPITPGCRLRDALAAAVEAFYAALDRITLADLTEQNCILEEILRLDENRVAGEAAARLCGGPKPAEALKKIA